VDRSSAEGCGMREGVSPPRRGGVWRRGLDPSPESFFFIIYLKVEHFGTVFKLDLTEETTTQLEEEVIASSCRGGNYLLLSNSGYIGVCSLYTLSS